MLGITTKKTTVIKYKCSRKFISVHRKGKYTHLNSSYTCLLVMSRDSDDTCPNTMYTSLMHLNILLPVLLHRLLLFLLHLLSVVHLTSHAKTTSLHFNPRPSTYSPFHASIMISLSISPCFIPIPVSSLLPILYPAFKHCSVIPQC